MGSDVVSYCGSEGFFWDGTQEIKIASESRLKRAMAEQTVTEENQ